MKKTVLFFLMLLQVCALADSVSYLQSLNHWSKSCKLLQNKNTHGMHYQHLLRNRWRRVCHQWSLTQPKTERAAKHFLNHHFHPYLPVQKNTLITGYYAPIFHACWMRQPGCETPILGLPRQPFRTLTRSQINHHNPHQFPIIAWMGRVDRYFLQVQGSGELYFNSGDHLDIGYASKNHLPYTSIGRYLIEHHRIERKDLNMSGIKHYLRTHPDRQESLFEQNHSFVFFKIQHSHRVTGKLGTELKSQLSAAVDNRWVPLGTLIKVSTTDPFHHRKWHLLLTAEDTGGAIRGRHHIDVYMGKGMQAGHWAGNMSQSGQLIFYVPN